MDLVHPGLVVAGLHGLQNHPRPDEVVCANFEGLVAPHEDAVVAFVGMFQDPDVPRAALFPLGRFGGRVPAVKLRPDLERVGKVDVWHTCFLGRAYFCTPLLRHRTHQGVIESEFSTG